MLVLARLHLVRPQHALICSAPDLKCGESLSVQHSRYLHTKPAPFRIVPSLSPSRAASHSLTADMPFEQGQAQCQTLPMLEQDPELSPPALNAVDFEVICPASRVISCTPTHDNAAPAQSSIRQPRSIVRRLRDAGLR